MGNVRRTYTREFKLNTLKMVDNREKSISQIEREMGFPIGVFFRWKRQLSQDGERAFPGHGWLKDAETRIEELGKEVSNLRLERDIQKKRFVFFRRTKNEISIY